MLLPAKLTIHNAAYALDGGTTEFHVTDEAGRDRTVVLVQHASPRPSDSLEALPGRLYVDGELISLRSTEEASLLALLRTADINCTPLPLQNDGLQLSPHHSLILGDDIRQVLHRSPEDNIRAMLTAVVEFVESDAYLHFANRIQQAADPVRYTAWITFESEDRPQAIVLLSRFLGSGVKSARELLDSGAPLAQNATALEVSALVSQYTAAGFTLHIEPTFPWRFDECQL